MKVKKWTHTTDEQGNCSDGGTVHIHGAISMSKGEGCGWPNCSCSKGYWIMIAAPRDEYGIVDGMTVYFDSQDELQIFLNQHKLNYTPNQIHSN